MNPNRREMIAGVAGLLAAGVAGRVGAAEKSFLSPGLPAGTVAEAELDSLPGKKPLIKLTYRPPNYETPLSYFQDVITPNDSFFVRWHLANIPEIDAAKWRLGVAGATPLSSPSISSGTDSRRARSSPSANARATGAACPIPMLPELNGATERWGTPAGRAPASRTSSPKRASPTMRSRSRSTARIGRCSTRRRPSSKAFRVWKAMDENTIVAYEMNGQPLPHFNGFPARLIVPGWTATYWMKKIVDIRPIGSPERDFWMATAYRVPARMFPSTERFASQEAAATTPITEIMVNSVITAPANGEKVRQGPIEIKGLAWDGGHGVASVEIRPTAG